MPEDSTAPAPITEHATLYAGGSMLVWNEAQHITEIYPTDQKILQEKRIGAKIFQRRVIVVDPWTAL